MATIKTIQAKDRLVDDILGVVPYSFTKEQELDLIKKISSYYGFECTVIDKELTR